jgi:hypothetical protein
MGWPAGHPEAVVRVPQQVVVRLEAGHKRGQTPRADKTDVGLRGVPVIGHGSGAISDTAPGGELGAAARLERAGRELVRAHRNRFKAQTA